MPVLADIPIISNNGTLSALNQNVSVTGIIGQASCTTTVTGTWSGTLTFEQSGDSINFITNTLTATLGGTAAGTTTSNGTFYSPLGTAQTFRVRVSTYSSGNPVINITCSNAPVPVSSSGGGGGGGSVTQGTSPWVISCANGATCPTNATLQSGSTTAVTQPTGTNLHTVIDSGTVTPTFPYGMTQSQTASTTSGAGALCAYFTAAPTLTNGQVNPLACDVSGNLRNVNIGWGGATLAAATAPGTASSGNIITVQGNASNVPLPVSGSVSVSNFPTPSPLGQALSSASIPVVPASDWVGSQKICDKTTTTQCATVDSSGRLNENLTQINGVNLGSPAAAGTSASGNILAVQGVTSGVPVNAALVSDVTSSGNSLALQTLNAAISVAVVSKGVVAWQVVGLTGQSATLTFECSSDGGTTWSVTNVATGTTDNATSTITTDGRYSMNASGCTNARLRVSTAGATTNATISYVASPLGTMDGLTLPIPPGNNSIGTVTQPYSMSGGVQTATSASGVGMVGVYNTTAPAPTNGQAVPIQLGADGSQYVGTQQQSSLNNNLVMTSTSNAVTFTVNKDYPIVRDSLQISGSTGTHIIEGQIGDGQWQPLPVQVTNAASQGQVLSAGTFVAAGIYSVNASAYTQIRDRVSVAGTGTAIVSFSSGLSGFSNNTVAAGSGTLNTIVSLTNITQSSGFGSGTAYDVLSYPGATLTSWAGSGTTASTVLVATGVSGKKTYVFKDDIGCVGTSCSIQLIEGTGATCGTSTTNIPIGPWSWTTEGSTAVADTYSIFNTATTGDNLCATITGTTTNFWVSLSGFQQ